MFAKEFWLESQLSVAKYSGGIDISEPGDGTRHFLVVNAKGQPFYGNLMQKNVPADLVDKDFIPLYRKLGRERFISLITENPRTPRKELKQILSDVVLAEETAKKEKIKAQTPSFFD